MIENLSNTSNITFTGLTDMQLFTASAECVKEWEVCQRMLSTFKVEIINSITTRFKIALALLTIILIYKMYIDYHKPKFSQTEIYQTKVKYRIDFALMIILITMIGLMFI